MNNTKRTILNIISNLVYLSPAVVIYFLATKWIPSSKEKRKVE